MPPELSDWLARVEANPIVTALSRCVDGHRTEEVATGALGLGGPAVGGPMGGASSPARVVNGSLSREPDDLESARTVLQERALTLVLDRNATERSVVLLERFFGWPRLTGTSIAEAISAQDDGGATETLAVGAAPTVTSSVTMVGGRGGGERGSNARGALPAVDPFHAQPRVNAAPEKADGRR